MHPADINARLIKAGWNQSKLARELGVSQSLVSLVIRDRGRSRRVAEAIANVVQLPVDRMWPGAYPSQLTDRAA